MALSDLRPPTWSHGQSSDYDVETRGGIPICSGEAYAFDEWSFRLHAKQLTSTDEQKKLLAVPAVEGLRGNALKIARRIGAERLMKEDGLDHLIHAIRAELLPLAKVVARELFSLGAKSGGMLAWQHAEPMREYIFRREGWYRKLTELDGSMTISEDIRCEMLLDNAGLTRDQKLMIMTSTGNSMNFEKIASCLREQHHDVHEHERQHKREYRGGKGGSQVKKGR